MKLARDPLLHFLLLGAVIFAVFRFSRSSGDKPGEIVVTRGTVENLVTGFTRTWQRPPNEDDLKGLIREYIREEVAYRQAIAMGLDRDDTIVRRRLRQKLEFISEDLATRAEPSDRDLQAFMQSHESSYQTDATFTFRHVYLDPQKHGPTLKRDTGRVLAQLRASGTKTDFESAGDPFLLQKQFERVSVSEVKQVLGEQFASGLSQLKSGTWEGPVRSGYGVHLVLVTERSDKRQPPLAEVRNEVRREWLNAKRLEASDKFYQALLQHYTIKIEPLEEQKIAQVH